MKACEITPYFTTSGAQESFPYPKKVVLFLPFPATVLTHNSAGNLLDKACSCSLVTTLLIWT